MTEFFLNITARVIVLAVAMIVQSPVAESCPAITKANTTMIMMTLGGADNNQTISIHVDDTIQVSLPENASTGFRWAIDHYSDAVIEAVTTEPRYADKAVGSGGEIVFTFKGKKPGTGDIELKYWRSFEGDKSATNRYRLKLQVQP